MNNKPLLYHALGQIAVVQTTVTTTIPAKSRLERARKMSNATLASHKQDLGQFTEERGFKLAELGTNGEALELALIDYIVALANKGSSYGRLNLIDSAVKKYCKLYKIHTINFDNIYEYMPKHVITVED